MHDFPHPRGYVCYRAPEQLAIDGDLSKTAWLSVPWTEPFGDIEGDLRPAPPFRTRVKMLWDDSFLYLAAELEEPHVWATLTEHDAVIFQDPDFEVFLDPDGDNHEYYELEINAFNTTWDLRLPRPYRDGGPALNAWEIPGMKSAVRVLGTCNNPTDLDLGWTVEMALPWNVLGEYATCPAPPRDGDQWRINFSRVEWDVEVRDGAYYKIADRPEHNWVWSPQHAIDMHRPEFWGYVQFSEAAPGARIPFVPDPSWPTRCALMEIYRLQKAFFATHGRWAEAEEIDVPEGAHLQLGPEGWEAVLDGFRVRQDSHLTRSSA